MKKLIVFLKIIFIIFGLILLIILFTQYLYTRKIDRIIKNKCVTSGFVKRLGNNKGNYVIVQCIINDSVIEFNVNAPLNEILVGENFEVQYNCNNLKDYEIFFETPVFISRDSSKINETKGRIQLVKKYSVRFSYIVNGTVYYKEQAITKDFNVDISKTYRVSYLNYYPSISMIHIYE